MITILIHNQKGGVGKTTTAANLGAALARAGHGRVVLADLDPQAHLTAALGFNPAEAGWTAERWLSGQPGRPVEVPGEPDLQLIPGGSTVTGLKADGSVPPIDGADWLLMDASAAWTSGLAGLMRHSDIVLSPLEADFMGMNGISRLMRQMEEVGLPRSSLRLLICRFSPRLSIHREVRAKLAEHFGNLGLLPVVIRNSVRLTEAPGQGRTIFSYAPGSTGAIDYALLAEEIAASAAALSRGPNSRKLA